MSITKKVKQESISVIEFTPEEMEKLKLKPNWKYEFKDNEDGSFSMIPYEEVEIDFNQFDKSVLIELIKRSVEQDVSINEVLEEVIKECLEHFEDDSQNHEEIPRKSENMKFSINVEMKERWVPHFLGMLNKMEQLGNLGSSRKVSFYSDGDGDFRPKFSWNKSLPLVAQPKYSNNEIFYDAG